MKKVKIFICALVCLLTTASVVAQTSVVAKQPHLLKTQKTLIKERPDYYPATITCVNAEGKAYFILYDSYLHCFQVELEDSYVNDMVVTKDSVFFCGKSLVDPAGSGMIGYFDIDNVYSGTDAIYTQDYFAVDPDHVSSNLFRMDIYMNNIGERCITCVGTCINNNSNYPFIVSMVTGLYAGYVAGYVNDKSETFCDVKYYLGEFDNRMVTSGFDDTYGHYISLRAYYANNIFNPSGPQDHRNTFNMDTCSIREWVGDEVLLQQVNMNKLISTLSYRLATPNSNPSNCNVHLGFYDIGALMSGSLYSMVNQIEIPMEEASWRSLNQYVFDTSTRKFTFLKTIVPTLSGVTTSIFCESKYLSTGNLGFLRAYTYPDNIMQGMTLFDSNYKYVMSGYLRTSPDQLKYELETFGNMPSCATPLGYEYLRPSLVESMRLKKPFVHIYGISLLNAHYSEITELPVFIECEKTEEF